MRQLELTAEGALPVRGCSMRIRTYEYGRDPAELVVALFHRRYDRQNGVPPRPLVRIHSQCLTGDTFGSARCDCGAQLEASLEAIAEEPWGVLIYLPSHEGRGIGLVNKIRAYALQDDDGLDTVEANLALRLPVDARRYDAAVAVLADLEVQRLRLLTNNPRKLMAVLSAGMDVFRIPMPMFITEHNSRYLATKRDVMGHAFPKLAAPCPGGATCSNPRCTGPAKHKENHDVQPAVPLPDHDGRSRHRQPRLRGERDGGGVDVLRRA
jgi:3,4-dihydroxy 2-butanone 4-phosphate synthase/GTP cyclohydrolase II